MSGKFKFIGVYDYTVVLTYISLVSSIIGIMKAVEGKFSAAVICLMISGFCDAFDGVVARTKKNRTEDEKGFGIQLDSLCDVICFGLFPAFLCYMMGMNGIFGIMVVCAYCLCAVIRLAFFNVLETKRQKTEDGCAKFYRGLPVTSISMIFPVFYCLKFVMGHEVFMAVICGLMMLVAFMFVWDIAVPKPDWKKILKLPI